jgi:hypothetical protein
MTISEDPERNPPAVVSIGHVIANPQRLRFDGACRANRRGRTTKKTPLS